ncbi:hypothetical protein BBJ28_00001429 [Nothophytophthora sp. Chile5]|nr:hypothetical protein BBJ28_00001429 [Nothophytophthora sp. Chile5]
MGEFLESTLSNLEKNDMDTVRGIVQTFRSLAVYFRKSPKARNRLARIQENISNDPKNAVINLIVDCPTRWNSCWDMLLRFIRLQPALNHFFVYLTTTAGRKEFKDMENKLSRPKDAYWLAIKCLRTLLAPFASVSTQLGGQMYPTLPLVVPALSGLRTNLKRRDLFHSDAISAGNEPYVDETLLMMQECRAVVRRLCDARFSCLEATELAWVAYLDPRIAKKMSHLRGEDKPRAGADLVSAAVKLVRDSMPLPRVDADRRELMLSPIPTPHEADDFISNYMFGPDDSDDDQTPLEQICDDEFKRYLADITTVKKLKNPFQWWKENQHKYPNLSKLARKWLGTVATSVPSERAFSSSGNVVTVKRSSLAPELVRDLVFIAENTRPKRGDTTSVVAS